MTVRAEIIAETGLDLADSNIGVTTLASEFAARLQPAFNLPAELVKLSQGLMDATRMLSGPVTPLGVYKLAFSTLKTAASLLEGRLDDDISTNFRRLEAARNTTIQQYIKTGDWSVAVPAGGPPVGSVDLKNNVGGWPEGQFLAQYNPGIVWMAKKVGADILLPTWPTPPFTEGFGFISGSKGVQFPLMSPLTGFERRGPSSFIGLKEPPQFFSGQPDVAAFPAKYDEDYFGLMPAASEQDLADLRGDYATKLKALERLIQKMETNLWAQPFVPPPDYWYLFSVGTYPYYTWNTATTMQPAIGGSPTVLNGTMAAIAAAIHSFTGMHAAIDARQVAQCYAAWRATTRLDLVVPDPHQQFDPSKCAPTDMNCGVWRDELGLPTSPSASAVIQCITKLKPGQEQSKGYPKGFGPSYRLNWAVARSIEQSFRSFFRIRRAAIYQIDKLSEDFKAAARAGGDPVLAAVASGKAPPPYKPWSEMNPIGDLTSSSGFGSVGGIASVGGGGGGGGGLILGGLLALGLGYLLLR